MTDRSGDYVTATIRARKEAEETELANRIAKGDATALFDAIMYFWATHCVGNR